VHYTRMKSEHQHEPDEDRNERRRHVKDAGHKAQASHIRAGANTRHASDNRGHDEGHDEHLESAQEQLPQKSEDARKLDPKEPRLCIEDRTHDDGKPESDEDLPVNFELGLQSASA